MVVTVSRGASLQVLCAMLMVTVPLADARPRYEDQKRVCESDDFLQIQQTCRVENDALLLAEKKHDDGMVCKALFDLWYCVAGNVPLCFHNLTNIYGTYFHSPHNCALSPSQIMILQNLTTTAARRQGQEGEVDVEVDIIVPLPPDDHFTSSPEDSSLGKGEEGEDDEGTVHVRRPEEHSGSNDPTGAGSTLLGRCTLPGIVMSWLCVWRVTSYLLHS